MRTNSKVLLSLEFLSSIFFFSFFSFLFSSFFSSFFLFFSIAVVVCGLWFVSKENHFGSGGTYSTVFSSS